MAPGNDRRDAEMQPVVVWDAPVRMVHWLLVVLVATSWITSEIGGNAMTYHMWSGYTILTLLLFRIVWGFVGGRHARFSSFLTGPRKVLVYAGGLLRGEHERFLGHNPLGAWSVIAMLLSLGVQAGTGLFAYDEIFTEGPLAHRVSAETSSFLTTIHYYNFYVLMVLIVIHLIAISFYLVVKRENLVSPMITGRKVLPSRAAAEASTSRPWLATVLFIAVAGMVAAIVNWA